MATTKVINDLIDLNQTGNTTALKGCKGDNANQPQTPTVSVDYLVVAGGGGGGGYGQAGAGGAGGFLDGTIAAPNNTEINIVVGLGGAGGTGALPATGINGQDSGFYTIQSQGGGGSQAHTYGGLPGGSGGGSATLGSVGFTGGSGVSGQGNAGGTAVAANYNNSPYSGSGGGGAGTAGTSGNNIDGDGGRGKTTTIITTANASTANVGQNSGLLNVTAPAFAGGGGGGAFGATCGDGGDGGGGDGNIGNSVYPLANNGYSGTINTGGGGGGVGSYGPDTNRGGNGGSGVVILKYANADVSNVTIDGSLIGGINPVDNSAVVDFPAGTGCQALYQFENNTNDSSSNNYDPTSEANISFPTSSPAPKFGTYSLKMNGSSSYVNGIPQTLATTLRTAGLFTFSMWINPIAAPSGLADFIRFIDNIYVRILINSDLTLGYVVIPVAGTYIEPPLTTSVAKINLNEWSHVCLTGSVANGIKFYINGQQEAYNPAWVGTFMTYTDTNYKTNGLNGSSGLPGNANQVMDGNIDNFRVYNQELSSSQVLQLAYMNIDTKFDDGTNTTLVFKGGSGTINLTGSSVLGPKVGDLRTNEDQTSGGSASAMEHFMSTGWRVFTNTANSTLGDCNYPTAATALYQFNDTADSSCTPAYNGNFTNPNYVASKTGFGKAADFDGTNTRINIGDSSNFAGNKLTFSFWANPGTANSSNYQLLFGNYIGGSFADYDFMIDRQTTQKLEVGITGSGSSFLWIMTDSAAFVTGTWKNYVIVIDTTESVNTDKIKIYVNGTLVARSHNTYGGSVTGSLLDTSDDFFIGDWAHDTSHRYSGLMDQVRIFPSALTQGDIDKLANET